MYESYVKNTLQCPEVPYLLVADNVEQACWGIVHKTGIYASANLIADDIKKLWQMFNRLSVEGSYTKDGPVVKSADVNWLVAKIMADTAGMDVIFYSIHDK